MALPIHTARDGTVKKIVRRQFGLAFETRFTWRETKLGPVLANRKSFDPRRQSYVEHAVDYESRSGRLRPTRVTLRMPGRLPRDVPFVLRY